MALRRRQAEGLPVLRDSESTDGEAEPDVAGQETPPRDPAPLTIAAQQEPAFVGQLEALADELASLRSLFEDRLRYDDVREAHFTRVYAELDLYKVDEASERMIGLARGLILVLDKLREADLPSEFVRGALEECLASEGVELIPEVDTAPGVEEVVGFLDESDEQDRRVVSEGFRYGERVVRPRRVLVKRGRA